MSRLACAVSYMCLFLSASSMESRTSDDSHSFVLDKPFKISARRLPRIRRSPDTGTSIDIRKFYLTSKLYFRFAKVTIESEVVNNANDARSQEIAFTVQVPESAFMSNFTMEVDGVVYVAKVMEKDQAQKQFDEARAQNKTAGQVKQVSKAPARGTEVFSISVNLAPRAAAYFTLTYHELLDRRLGKYTQRLFLAPGGIVANLKVEASFAEEQGFKSFVYKLPGDQTEYTSGSDNVVMKASVSSRALTYKPSVEEQRTFNSKTGITGELVVTYDVSRQKDGGFVVVQDNFFSHFVSPWALPVLPKNLLFIIDISGSMSGPKIQKAMEAMLSILDVLGSRGVDAFNILLFDDQLEVWRGRPTKADPEEVKVAKGYVKERLEARGATDIHRALMRGLVVLLGEQKQRSCDTANMIVFLTDGDPTAGVTNTNTIISEVTRLNNGRASIFSLGFGFTMNFEFLSALSENNAGFARHIYDESDANIQLQTFYEEISQPVACDIQVVYNTELVDAQRVSDTTESLYFDGKELVVVGEIKTAASKLLPANFGARLQGTGANGNFDLAVPTGNIKVIGQADSDVESGLTEKLYAYQKIKQLLASLLKITSEVEKNRTRQMALELSLKHGFVTPLTSFSTVVNPASRDITESDVVDYFDLVQPSRDFTESDVADYFDFVQPNVNVRKNSEASIHRKLAYGDVPTDYSSAIWRKSVLFVPLVLAFFSLAAK